MLTIKVLRKRAKREKIIVSATLSSADIALQLAQKVAEKEKQSLPSCYGILFQRRSSKCLRCLVRQYCEVVYEKALYWDANLASELTEKDIDLSMPIGFKEGSRAHMFVRKWNRMLSIEELKDLSRTLFKSTIDIQRIIDHVKQRRLLIKKGVRFGIKTRLRHY